MADEFYDELVEFMECLGFSVTIDPGLPYTSPPPADVWVGHSRGVDRLEYAPEGTLTVPLSVGETCSIDHPRDDPHAGKSPDRYHFTVTPEMRSALRIALSEIRVKAELREMIRLALLEA